jgi:hypothetical protein
MQIIKVFGDRIIGHSLASPPYCKIRWVNLEKWEWAWLAGIFEGEGSIHFSNVNSVQVKIGMTDKDVLETVDRLFPSPNGLRHRPYEYKKDQWFWMVSSKEAVEEYLQGILPFLLSRRRARAEEGLERLARNRGARSKRTHCPRGHPLAGDNLYFTRTTGAHSCLTCRRTREIARNARMRQETAQRKKQRALQEAPAAREKRRLIAMDPRPRRVVAAEMKVSSRTITAAKKEFGQSSPRP